MACALQDQGMVRRFLLAIPAVLGFAVAAAASECEALAFAAERTHGIPAGLLVAIARTESGRSDSETGVRAWPWTANIAGEGRYYATRGKALKDLEQVLSRGEESFDVGCMQLNWYWHGDHFRDLAEMIEPQRNVAYAARFLSELRQETGDWTRAAQLYHSRDAERGAAYGARVAQHWETVALAPGAVAASQFQFAVPGRSSGGAPRKAPIDRRFEAAAPLVQVDTPIPYWISPGLGDGALPRFGARPPG